MVCLDNYFMKISERPFKAGKVEVYFTRVEIYDAVVGDFLDRYCRAVLNTRGVAIENGIPNPSSSEIQSYSNIVGINFSLDINNIRQDVDKWIPELHDSCRRSVTLLLYKVLVDLRNNKKSDSIIKNTYIKYMCWLKERFGTITGKLNGALYKPKPKVLCIGKFSMYEILFLHILKEIGCDVVLVLPNPESIKAYKLADPNLKYSELYQPTQPQDQISHSDFPEGFNLDMLVSKVMSLQSATASQPQQPHKSLQSPKQPKQQPNHIQSQTPMPPSPKPCMRQLLNPIPLTTDSNTMSDILKVFEYNYNQRARDAKGDIYYNHYYRINGVEDKTEYSKKLYNLYINVKKNTNTTNVLLFNGSIPIPDTSEIMMVRRNTISSDSTADEVANDLLRNWCKFDVGCCIFLGECKEKYEADFLMYLSKLPVDVLILEPNNNHDKEANQTSISFTTPTSPTTQTPSRLLNDSNLRDIYYNEKLNITAFPCDESMVQAGTIAYHAEREIGTVLQREVGLLRRGEDYRGTITINLQTMYEEISLLWNEDLQFRPNFSVDDGVVSMPVICAKVTGVKGDLQSYWRNIKGFIRNDTLLFNNTIYIGNSINSIKPFTSVFYKNGKLFRDKIKSHKCYQYNFLKEEIQDYILNKLELLIKQKCVTSQLNKGAEYLAVAIVLSLDEKILRLIQRFNFVGKNPKAIYINTGKDIMSLEDSIFMTFLNLIGFDILFFVPTGYQSIEKYFDNTRVVEHQVGDYVFDLSIPNFNDIPSASQKPSWYDRIFKRRK